MRVAFVVGASSEIGKSIVTNFARNGYDVVIHYFKNEVAARELADFVSLKYGVKALLVSGDISVEADVLDMISKVILEFGQIDVLVNNAAIALDSCFFEKSVLDFKRVIDVNLIGTFLVSKYVAKEMNKRGSGSIICISSNNAIDMYYPESCDYDASKAGVNSLVHNMALEFAPYIRVNGLALGWVNSGMSSTLDDSWKEKECKKILLGRFALPSEIADVVYFVAAEANYINGTIIKVDGGVKYGS